MRRVAVVGSTGSIGQSALELIRENRREFSVELLVAGRQWEALARSIVEFRPSVAGLSDRASFEKLQSELGLSALATSFEGTRLVCGESEICVAIAESKASVVLAAVVGMAGLPGVLAAARAGKSIALANKESLVVAGGIVLEAVRASGAHIVPVDSEHSAIFQCLQGVKREDLESVILTSSGGPFRTTPATQFDSITVEKALKHPKWSMGAKISIDSATMMNKALEVIEAHWLFDLPPQGIEVVVHPEHIIHSLIRLRDGSVLAQLSVPDMKGPIGFGLTYPERRLRVAMPHLDLYKVAQMNFEQVDDDRFPGVSRAKECLRVGGGASAVMNSANEVAVEAFLQKKIPLTGINRLIGDALHSFGGIGYSGLEDLLGLCSSVTDWARQRVGIVPK